MKVLITANLTEDAIKRLEALGLEVVYDPWGPKNRLLLSEELAERMENEKADALIIEIDLCHEEVFEKKAPEFIGCCRGDPLIVDLDEALETNTPVFYTPGRNADAVADLALAMMIGQMRNMVRAHTMLSAGNYSPETPADVMSIMADLTGRELGSTVVGIVGLGMVGCAVAKRLDAFGSAIIAYDPFAPGERFKQYKAEKIGLKELFEKSDIVTLHASDDDENNGMITREMIESMKPDALFINLARASLVDDDALFETLESKKIGGACLDVFVSEPPTTDNRYIKLDNVIVTPHIAGATHDVVQHQSDMIVSDIEAYLTGGEPRFCANPEVLAKKRGG
jgi:D-3-phosphoglycerate dehydrogenase / 2-oxoglutarate reductase